MNKKECPYCGPDGTMYSHGGDGIICPHCRGSHELSIMTGVDPVQIGFFERTGEEDGDIAFRPFYEGMNDVPERWVAAYADRRYLEDFMKEKPYSYKGNKS